MKLNNINDNIRLMIFEESLNGSLDSHSIELMQKEFPDSFVSAISRLKAEDMIGAISSLADNDAMSILSSIRDAAKSSGNKENIDRLIAWLYNKTNGNISNLIKTWEETKNKISSMMDEAEEDGVKKRTLEFLLDKFGKMDKALNSFMSLIGNRIEKIKSSGVQYPDHYINDVANEIRNTYKNKYNNDPKDALDYRRRMMSKSDADIKAGCDKVFGRL